MSPLPAPEPLKFEVLRSIRNERRRTIAFLREQPPEAFDAPATPGWRVRDVVAHLITLDRAAVAGAVLPLILGTGTERIERWNDRAVVGWADRPVPSLILGLDRWGRRYERQVGLVPRRMYRARFPTVWGRIPGAYAIWIRAYDEFVHRQDIRRALGLADDDVDATAIAEFLLGILPFHALPAIADADRRGSVGLALAGEPISEWVYDLASGKGGPIAPDDGVDARVRVDGTTSWIMTAATRGTFDDLESSGILTIEGDTRLARSLLSAIRLV